ncbi:hypothetical protein SDC9_210020 [bioreactor metagenome]|uniref:Uncharacterized protein n=1 Tax=bioreactor metagenome TaxID=1076179 RepID=A0A645JSA9_9ZZZZ
MASTGDQPVWVAPPSSQTSARRRSPLALIISSEERAEQKELTTTPARIRLVVGMVLPTRAIMATTATASTAPMKAERGTAIQPTAL